MTNSVSGDLPAGDSKKTTCRFEPEYISRAAMFPHFQVPTLAATALHSVLHTGEEEPSGPFGDPSNSCARDRKIRTELWLAVVEGCHASLFHWRSQIVTVKKRLC